MMLSHFLVIAQAGGGPGWRHWMVMLGGIAVIFYFFMIRPEKKRQETKRKMLHELGKKDKVITAGGIHGTVKNTSEKTVTLIVDDKKDSTIKVSRSAIVRVVTDEEKKNTDHAQQ